MATSPVTAWDASGNPVQNPSRAPVTAWDASGNPIDPSPSMTPDEAQQATDALVYSHLTGAPPSVTYEHRDELNEGLTQRLEGYAAAGWKGLTKDSIIGEYMRGQLSGPFETDDEVSKFIEGFGQMLGDLPSYIAGGYLGGIAGAAVGGAAGTPELPVIGTVSGTVVGAGIGRGAGGFALTAGLRQWLVDKYAGKKISAWDEVMDVLKASGKGALTGAAFGAAEEVAPLAGGTVGRFLGPRAYKTAAELAAMTTVGSALEGRVPTAHDFVQNAAMLAALHVGTMGVGAAKDYLSKTYVDTGVHPADTVANPDGVPPPVEQADSPAPTGMLRPAIREGEQVTVGEPGEEHQDILDRMTPEKPPKTEGVTEEPEEAEHGFVDQQGRFMTRQEARQWVDENEPQVAEILGEGGELHSEDYNAANELASADREPSVQAPTAEVSGLRKILTKIRDGSQASKFGASLRTFFVGNRDARIAETNQLAGSLRKLVPDYRDQEALTLMRDFKNNRADLEARRARYEAEDNAKLKKLIPIIDRALNPSDAMKDADRQLTEYFTKRLDEGKRLGFIDSSISNEEYINHLLRPETEESVPRGTSGPQIGRNFRFNRERKYDTILDALETGTVKAQTLNSLDALTVYGAKHATAAATRIFINELKQSELGKWGFKRADNMPADWVELATHSGLFRNTVPYIDRETGEPTFAYQSLMVPPKVRDAMAPIIEGANVTGVPGFQTLKAVQAYIKAAELGLSVFHIKALSITALNNQGISGLVRSMAADSESSAFKGEEVDGVRAGLQTPVLGRTIEAYRSLTKETLPDRRNVIDMIRSAPGIKQLDQLASGLTHFTFDVLQRKFKVTDYSIKKAAWMAKHPDATADQVLTAKRGIAKEVNAAYGGLNWEVLGASKTFRNVAQALLLAPDWTFSNIFNAKYAFEGGPAGAAARSFWIRSAATGMALTQAMSIMATGQMSSHPAEVYLGKDKDGREIYGNMFFAGAPKDFITFLNNMEDYGAVVGLARTIDSKLSPLLRGSVELATNKDYMGRDIVTKGKGVLSNTAKGAWHIASEAAPVPFSITQTIKMLTDTKHDHGFWDYASVLGGTPPRHVLPADPNEAKAIQKRERKEKEQKNPRKKKFTIRGGR